MNKDNFALRTPNSALRILILEDVPTDAELVEKEFRKGGFAFTTRRVDARDDFIKGLEEFKPDLILADYKLPAFDGLSALEIKKERSPDVPFIFVTGAMGEELAVETMRNGAADYVLKDRLFKLVPAVKRALQEKEELLKRRQAEAALRESEERFHTIFTEAHDGIVLIDAKTGSIVDCNPEFERQTGRELEELKRMRIWEIRPPEKVEAARKKFQEVAVAGVGGASELEFQQPGGEIVPIEFLSKKVVIGGKEYLQSISRDITERKKAEEALRLSEERYSVVTNSASDAIICINTTDAIYLWNKRAEEMFGFTAEEAMGKLMHQLIVPEKYREKAYEGLKDFYQTGTGEVVGKIMELTALKKDGTEFPVELSVSAMKVNGDWHATGIVRDITERKKAEEALRKSEKKYRTLLENLEQKIFYKDRNSVYISCNENYARDLKIKADEIEGRTDYDFYPKELAEKYRADDKRLMELGETEEIDEKYIKDGQELWVHTVKTPIMDDSGNVIGILGIFWDITERKKAEEALRESEEKLQRIINGASAVIFVKDLNGKYLLINSLYEKLFHVSKTEIVGKTDYDIFPKEVAEALRDGDKKASMANEPIETEEIVPQDDGTHYYISLKFPLYDVQGRPYAVCGIATDITERKKAEETLKQRLDELTRFEKATIQREFRMRDLKDENKRLKEKIEEMEGKAKG